MTVPDDAGDAGGVAEPQRTPDGAAEAPRSRGRHRRVVRPGTEQGPVPGASADERDSSSRDRRATAQGNDARLREDVPPHWEPSKRF